MVKSGDMVCLVTTIKGLDVSHVGFALHKDGILTFIHASLTAKKVVRLMKEIVPEYKSKNSVYEKLDIEDGNDILKTVHHN